MNKKLLAPLLDGTGTELRFTHFSVFVHAQRRLPLLAAVNIRGEEYSAESRGRTEPWKHADAIDASYQIDNRFYGNDDNTFDRGHLVRRVDPCWGDASLSAQAELDTFTWANCTPQHRKLNRDGGVWYQLEQHVMEHGVKNKIGDVSVFSGPVLADSDPVFKRKYRKTPVPIPELFWKIIVWKKSDGKLYAVGFLMDQREWIKGKVIPAQPFLRAKPQLKDDYFEKLTFTDNKTYQVPVADIEALTGIRFNWKDVQFLYTAKRPKAVRAVPFKKVYAFADIRRTASELVMRGRPSATSRALEASLQRKTPVSKKTVRELVAGGEAYRLRRYRLTNVTL